MTRTLTPRAAAAASRRGRRPTLATDGRSRSLGTSASSARPRRQARRGHELLAAGGVVPARGCADPRLARRHRRGERIEEDAGGARRPADAGCAPARASATRSHSTPRCSPATTSPSCASAELTGRLDDALDQLSEYLERERRRPQGAEERAHLPDHRLLALAVVAIVIMSVYVLPKFKDFYQGLDADLAATDPNAASVSRLHDRTGGGSSCHRRRTRDPRRARCLGGKQGKERRDALLLRMPVVGALVNLVAVERFCRVLAALVHTGVTAARCGAGRRPTARTTACSRTSSPLPARR